jgi:CheY-like chemotaxis protein
MRALGRPEREREEIADVDVAAELADALEMVRNQLVQRARLEVSVPSDLPRARAGSSELGRVFLNLLVNAAQAIPEGEAAAHAIRVTARHGGGWIDVEVADTGAGIPAELRSRIFEPFFTTKPVGVGTGLGLSIASSIVARAGGRMELESEVGRGARFRVRLPAAPPRAAPAPQVAARPAAPGARRRVLLVDDEAPVRRAIERLLRAEVEVVSAGSAAEALGRIESDPAWDAILCDLMMSGLDGIAFYEAIASRRPDLRERIAFVTGGAFGERATSFVAAHDVPIVPKPPSRPDLLAVIERLAAGRPAPAPRA